MQYWQGHLCPRKSSYKNDTISFYITKTRLYNFEPLKPYLIELNIEIDQAAKMDSGVFYKIVDNRRMTSHTSAGSYMKESFWIA